MSNNKFVFPLAAQVVAEEELNKETGQYEPIDVQYPINQGLTAVEMYAGIILHAAVVSGSLEVERASYQELRAIADMAASFNNILNTVTSLKEKKE